MKQENFNIVLATEEKYLAGTAAEPRKPRILVAPLDWGLGHATRCIPLIYELLGQHCEVLLAAEGTQEALLRQEFPHLTLLQLKGYRIKYGRSAAGMLWNILAQSPKILRAIRGENKWLQEMQVKHQFDAVISDNRYGLYHPAIPCIFITHQLHIKSPFGKWPERLLRKRNYKYIDRFRECWVPDEEGINNLAGELSHPSKKPSVPVKYIGPLSRLKKEEGDEKKAELLIILSGPEPQRTIFENKIVDDIAHYPGAATVVRGLPGAHTLIPSTNSIKFYNHLPAAELSHEMNRAEYVISRSGYSTIMDIIQVQKKSILVATPGQTEQEYLAGYLQQKKIALSVSQKSFSLTKALQLANSFPYSVAAWAKQTALQQVVSQFVGSLSRD